MLFQIGQTIDTLSFVGMETSQRISRLSTNPWISVGALVAFLIFFLLFILPRFLDHALGIGPAVAILLFGSLVSSLPLAVDRLGAPTYFFTRAARGKTPQNLQLVVLGPTNFTLEWQTNQPVLSAIRYGTDPQALDNAAFDRDPLKKTTRHQVIVKGLEPDTTYFVQIISGGQRFDFAGQPLEIRTPPR